ncbi:hypothetical protein ACFE04_031859 [Oxalis oulophora]
MDGREAPQPPQQQQAPPPPPPGSMMMGHNSFHGGGNASSQMINHSNSGSMINPNARFPFNTIVQQQQQLMDGGGGGSNGGGPGGAGGGGFDGSAIRFDIEPAKKKRGRPRKYTPDGNIALGLSPTPMSPAVTVARAPDSSGGTGGSGGGGGSTPNSDHPAKRNRGRPPGSGKKQLDALGSGGVGFTPHIILVKAGEDIAAKLVAFSQQGPRTVCILSANGSICNVTLRQPAMSGGTVTYEGRFEIISLSGSLLLSDEQGGRNRCGSMSVSLAGSDGRVLGGGVAGMLMAASPVQVIVGSFIADKKNSSASKSGPSSASGSHMLNFSAPVTTASPPSGASSDSSDDNGSSPPPLNRGPPGLFHNHGQVQQPTMQNMHMYHQLWAAQTPQ